MDANRILQTYRYRYEITYLNENVKRTSVNKSNKNKYLKKQ